MRVSPLGFFIAGAAAMALFVEGFYLSAGVLTVATGAATG